MMRLSYSGYELEGFERCVEGIRATMNPPEYYNTKSDSPNVHLHGALPIGLPICFG